MAIPLVYGGNVEPSKTGDSRFDHVSLDSPEGLEWLETIGSFRYDSGEESLKPFTVRKETTRTGDYWYAYKKIGGRLHKKYVGKSSEMTLDKLEEIAEALSIPPEPRVTDKVTEVTEGGKRVTEKVTDGVTIEEFTALKFQVQALQESLEALRSELPGKSDAGNPDELPTVTDSELQIELGNLKAENERLQSEYTKLLSSSHIVTEKLKQEARELRSQLETEQTRFKELDEECDDRDKIIAELRSELADLKQKSVTASEPPERTLPDALTILNYLRGKRKKSATTLDDVKAMLEVINKS